MQWVIVTTLLNREVLFRAPLIHVNGAWLVQQLAEWGDVRVQVVADD